MARTRNLEDGLKDLLHLAGTLNPLFILGAGASAPWIPTIPQVKSRIRKNIVEDIPGGTPQSGMGPLTKMLMVSDFGPDNAADLLLGLVTEETLRFKYHLD